MPILLYGLEVLNLNKSQLNSLDFVANRFLMKLFNSNNMQIIEFCCEQFNFILSSRQIANRRDKCIKSDSPRTNLLTFVMLQLLGDFVFQTPYMGFRPWTPLGTFV